MQLRPISRVQEDPPRLEHLRLIVDLPKSFIIIFVSRGNKGSTYLYEVILWSAGDLNLLEAVAHGSKDDRAVVEEVVLSMRPNESPSDTVRMRA